MKKFFLFIAVGVLLTLGTSWAQFRPLDKLRLAENVITQFYVDTVNEDKLVEDGIRGMLKELDPHSSYSTPEETRQLNEPLQGNFSGVGITFNMNKDTLYVIQTVSGGPSERVGVLAGDRIIAVNDTAVAGVKMSTGDISKRLRGPKGTKVNVKILRKTSGGNDTIDFVITRADIPIHSVDASYMVDQTTGYIRLNKFAADTPKEISEAIKKLKAKGMKNLILDLTDNGGGYLNASVDLLSELLSPKSLAVYTEGRNSPRYNHFTTPKGGKPLFDEGRLVVMVNQYTASASEITSGAIQDYDRGVIVGRRTFGKGLVQRPVPFPDGSMMRLTIAHYYTPTGRDIQKPYIKGSSDAYEKDITDRLNQGELMHRDSIHFADSLKVATLKHNRPIYGGGGITPDVFVPLDTMQYTKYYRDVMAKGLLNQFAIKYVDEHRKDIKRQYRSDDSFVKKFEVTDDMLKDIYDMAEKEGIKYNKKQAKASADVMKTVIKGLIGRDIYESQTYYKVYNSFDPIFRSAYNVLNSNLYEGLITGDIEPYEVNELNSKKGKEGTDSQTKNTKKEESQKEERKIGVINLDN
ncbi:MAG: S41 family peptidase [Prevotella sp.]|nr:S41 family peptidase [Bacteroides sp.]MCM1366611.1 S41 family peptidase [Prevotella sp.]MCM1437292.1 S41 family peptidase [Prevotella sp.]